MPTNIPSNPQPNSSQSILDMAELLRIMVEKKASDLHIVMGAPPTLRIDGKMFAEIAEEFHHRELRQPVGIVHKLRGILLRVEIQKLCKLLLNSFEVGVDIIDGKEFAFLRLATRVTDHAGTATGDGYGNMSGTLKMDEPHDSKQRTDMKT